MSFQYSPIRTAAALLTAFLLAACVLTACAGSGQGEENSQAAGPDDLQTKELFAMDTYMTLTAYGDDAAAALDEAEQEILRLNKLLSAEDSGSEIGLLNASGGGPASEETIRLVERAQEINAMTDGAFDITPCQNTVGLHGRCLPRSVSGRDPGSAQARRSGQADCERRGYRRG